MTTAPTVLPEPERRSAAIEEARVRAHEAHALLGPGIIGPTAIGVPARRFFALIWTIAVSEFKLKFYGSALGYIWQLMRPLMLFGVLYLFFTQIVRFSTVHLYPVVLLQGIIVFTFLAESTAGGLSSLVDKEILVRKIQFPRLAVPISIVLTAFFNLILNYVIVLLFLLIQGGTPHWTWLYEFPPLMLALIAFASGVTVLLSSLYVRFRDVRPIWEVLLQTLYFVSLILIPVEQVHNETLRQLLVLNPFAAIVQQLRHAVIDPGAPSVTDVLSSDWLLLIPVGLLVGIVAVGYITFNRMAPQVAEDL